MPIFYVLEQPYMLLVVKVSIIPRVCMFRGIMNQLLVCYMSINQMEETVVDNQCVFQHILDHRFLI